MNKIQDFGLLLTGVLIFLMAFSSAPANAQTGKLDVTCVGPAGAPEKDVKVTVMSMFAMSGKDKKSDVAGVAAFDKLDNGAYRVIGRKKGFAPAFFEFAVINNDAASVSLKLTSGADSKLYFEDPAVNRRADILLDEGTKAGAAGNAAEAEKLIAQALEIKPSDANALYNYAMAQARQGKFDQAKESFKKSVDAANVMISAFPKPKPGGPGGPGDMMGGPGGMMGGPGGMMGGPGGMMGGPQMFETIVRDATQQINLIPLMKAEIALGAKKFDEAIALYDEAIKANPQNPLPYANKALALTQTGKTEEALASVNKALELDPGNERAGQVKKALDALIETTGREKATALINEGNKLLESDASAALKNFEEANALTGEKQAVIWRLIGRARAKLNQDAEAVAAFKKAVEFAPADQLESYQMSLAQHHLNAKRSEEALDIVVAGAKDPEQRLTELFTKTKNNADSIPFAIAAIERVIKINPSNFDAVFELGQIYYLEKNDSQAKELLTRYAENGKDEGRIQSAKDYLIIIARRNK